MSGSSRRLLHTLIAFALFSIYGVQVCPFLEELSVAQLLLPVVIMFLLLLISRSLLQGWLNSVDERRRVGYQFRVDWLLYSLAGLLIALFNMLFYQGPLESGLKVVLGLIAFGFFVACDQALYSERCLAEQMERQGINIIPDSEPFPVSRKFMLFSIISALLMALILFLVVCKDLEWLMGEGRRSISSWPSAIS
ncbi:hypothetical protein [Dongshaea marina]|uniref:hypothetical protein n=1 Tax=Dongshaea marina TaxID=2047966 RepID=UPI001900468A|nr:hypothetical protein [Dongshaea marina]